METMGLNQIREAYLSFFQSKEHYRHESYSLIPEKDKSLLLINAGMAPLKPYFAGLEVPPSKRMTTCQKCIRTGDLENVGFTDRHGTFFEMLGNFSFGDYFKKEAITWSWEFVTEVLKLPVDKLWVTVYQDDDEAYQLWNEMIGVPDDKIVRLGKDDNFWEHGLGPCGPCSEIYFDRGEEHGCGSPDCKPGCECDRYVEFWNLVFTQFDKQEDGTYEPLPNPNIDTGMGLERIACIMQGTKSIFDVDTVEHILNGVCQKAGVRYAKSNSLQDVSIRIITDHLRSMTFMISDGIIPGNEGREYVLRRIIRRAIIHGRKLGIQGVFLAELCNTVIDVSAGAYPDLAKYRKMIWKVVNAEEEKFAATIDQGERIINGFIEEMKAENVKVLDGEKAFKLHDTYGFPIDLTKEIIGESGFTVDEDGFKEAMEEQKRRAQANSGMKDLAWDEASVDFVFEGKTEFTGYDSCAEKSVIKSIMKDMKPVDEAVAGGTYQVILDKTPFYAESGGQAADEGYIYNDNAAIGYVAGVKKFQNVFIHTVEVTQGVFSKFDMVEAMFDEKVRNKTAANHSATHLLQKALQEVLGDHVKQAGSANNAGGLRFDFNHYQAMTAEEIKNVEEIVNAQIAQGLPVTTREMPIKEAFKEGVMALFGEKYGDIVRVVSIGDFSKELCGGTHVKNSQEIGAMKIISESGVASGVRRIEAITGQGILEKYYVNETLLDQVSDAIKAKKDVLVEKAAALVEENKALKKEIEELKKAAMSKGLDSLVDDAKEVNGIKLITKQFEDYNVNDLRGLSDQIKESNKNVVMVFATVAKGKVTFLVSVTDDLVEKGVHAGKMIKEIAAAAGGGGGGKADMAQAGAKDPSKINDAFAKAAELL